MARISEGEVVSLNDLAVDLVGPSAVVLETVSRGSNITLGNAESLSVVESLDGSKSVNFTVKELAEFLEELATGLGGQLAPRAFDIVEGLSGGIDGNVDILLGSFLYGSDDFAVTSRG